MLDLDMSPYGLSVWGSWGVSVLALTVVAVRAVLVSARWKRELARLEALRKDIDV